MENATKALIIVAGVFIGLMIISLGLYLYSALGTYVEETNATMEENALHSFNTQFLDYINYKGENGNEKIFDLKIQDVITVANIAYENNRQYDFVMDGDSPPSYGEDTFYVTVNVNGVNLTGGVEGARITNLERSINKMSSELLTYNINKKYKCTVENVRISETTGRVCEITFNLVP